MTDSRDAILARIRRNLPEAVGRPAGEGDWIRYDDAKAQFVQMLESVGGRGVGVADLEALNRELASVSHFAEAARVCSLVEGVSSRNVDLDAVDDPHELQDVDFAVLPGRFAVAENGAVWIDDADVKHRVLYFLPQHLVLVVPASEILNNMHEAYERLSGAFGESQFGCFISGPSKTADIEQSLVIGAHGARSLNVFLLDG